VSYPAKFSLSYLLIDVYLTGHFPQLFIRYNPGPPDLNDISQASVYIEDEYIVIIVKEVVVAGFKTIYCHSLRTRSRISG
jgi:hypothetical protein